MVQFEGSNFASVFPFLQHAMPLPRFLMLGGFLGAGKTTAIARLARHFRAQGRTIGIVTNDQATDLVDTHALRQQGFDVGEVPGSCFCCNFNALTETVEALGAGNLPDVVLAEPVGSCTDLVATVIRPLAQIYQKPFDIAPYGVVVKPSHGTRILGRRPNAGFSPQAAYIFRKQIEEADFIALNRVDELAASAVDELVELLHAEYPGRPVLRMSAKTGQGFDALIEFCEQRGQFGQRLMEVDYDVYAAGEAELGWLNAQVRVTSPRPFALDALLLGLVTRLRDAFAPLGAETAHLKAIGLGEGAYGVANLVSSFTPPELSLASERSLTAADLIVNARVALDPTTLEQLVRDCVATTAAACQAQAAFGAVQSFRPGRPVPTHRILEGA